MKLPITFSQEEEQIIDQRLAEFQQFSKANHEIWFSELCFCLLTANAQAQKAIVIQKIIGPKGFLEKTEQEIACIIRSYNHRFHNTKAHYIVLARKYARIKDIIKNMPSHEAREFLVHHIKGLGYKEASHFLRNMGYHDVAIIDRHILKFLMRYNLIPSIPKSISKKLYLKFEDLLRQFGLPLDKLDLILWCHMTGMILK